MKKPELTHARLLELLHYEPTTGVFTWLVSRRGGVCAGDRAGSLHCKGYWRVKVLDKYYLAHRLAWFYVYGVWPCGEVDHRFEDKRDNRISELRDASHAQNQQNIEAAQRNSVSGVRGVSWHKPSAKWRAQISVDGVQKTVGLSSDLAVAAAMRAQARDAHYSGYIARSEQ